MAGEEFGAVGDVLVIRIVEVSELIAVCLQQVAQRHQVSHATVQAMDEDDQPPRRVERPGESQPPAPGLSRRRLRGGDRCENAGGALERLNRAQSFRWIAMENQRIVFDRHVARIAQGFVECDDETVSRRREMSMVPPSGESVAGM